LYVVAKITHLQTFYFVILAERRTPICFLLIFLQKTRVWHSRFIAPHRNNFSSSAFPLWAKPTLTITSRLFAKNTGVGAALLNRGFFAASDLILRPSTFDSAPFAFRSRRAKNDESHIPYPRSPYA
jgi:hypothetical protein